MITSAENNSGETAAFLVGGEFPYVSKVDALTGQPQVDFKKFGVSLDFTPVVLSEGRISLKVLTEVSDLSTDNALMIAIAGYFRAIKGEFADPTGLKASGNLTLA